MVSNLKRLTTKYAEVEDRIRIAGESEDGQSIVIWITHRLARRFIPAMVKWLDSEASPAGIPPSGKASMMQSFAQEAAVAGLKPQMPVSTDDSAPTWLAQALDVTTAKDHMTLTFRGQQDRSATVRFDATQLRQWLSILHRNWLKAEWSSMGWPDWIKHESSSQHQIVLH